MMMERAKTAPAPEPPTSTTVHKPAHSPSQSAISTAPPTNASAEERVQDLERRLQGIGGPSGESATAATPAAAAQQAASSATTASETTTAPSAIPAKQKAAQTGKNNPLLVSKNRRNVSMNGCLDLFKLCQLM